MDPELHRIYTEMGRVDETAVFILRGHLVLEEQLTKICELGMRQPAHVNLERMKFYHKAALARALSADHERSQDNWNLVKVLNELRNSLAHHLDRSHRQTKIAAVRVAYDKLWEPGAGKFAADLPEESAILFAFLGAGAFLAHVKDEVTAFRNAWPLVVDVPER